MDEEIKRVFKGYSEEWRMGGEFVIRDCIAIIGNVAFQKLKEDPVFALDDGEFEVMVIKAAMRELCAVDEEIS